MDNLRYVLETHLHADFVSGHMELAEKTGAPIYAPRKANCAHPHHALVNGEELTIGGLNFQLMETPGHTPDGAVYIVTDLERGNEPVLAFCRRYPVGGRCGASRPVSR